MGLPQIGQTLGGKYAIVRLLGEGGMAFVFEASHQRLQQRVAIKLLTPEFARDPELVKRFEREARAVARLRTKHVARVMDVDSTPEGIPYIVMEFLEGRDLDAELVARTRIPLGEAVDYILQACAGMLEAHGMGIVHRDLKPANLFLAKEHAGDDRVVKVLDFGISKIVGEATRLTGAGAVLGTVMYMSPEQVRAEPNVDTRADIWALGVILYELIAGRTPWDGHSHQIAAAIVSRDPPDIRTFAQVPDTVATTLRTMLQRDPARRFATVREVVASLAPFAPTGSIGAGIVEQIAMGQSGARSRPSGQGQVPTHTIPMGSRPGALEAASKAAQAGGPLVGPAPSAPTAPARVGRRSRSRLVLMLAVAVGLLGAAGVVLILVTAWQHQTPAGTPATAHSLSVTPSASVTVTAAPQPPAVSVEMTAAPPSTGTARRPNATSEAPSLRPAPPTTATAKKGADAGTTRPPFL